MHQQAFQVLEDMEKLRVHVHNARDVAFQSLRTRVPVRPIDRTVVVNIRQVRRITSPYVIAQCELSTSSSSSATKLRFCLLFVTRRAATAQIPPLWSRRRWKELTGHTRVGIRPRRCLHHRRRPKPGLVIDKPARGPGPYTSNTSSCRHSSSYASDGQYPEV